MKNCAFSKIWIIVAFAILIAGGIFAWQYFGVPKEKPEEVVVDETANWQIYRNEEYGFEFKYPLSFEFVKPGQPFLENEVWLGYFNSKSGQLSITVKDQKLDSMNIYGTYGKKSLNDLKTLTVDNKIAYMYTEADAGCGVDVVNIPLNNSTFKLRFSYCEEQNIESYKNQILSTFKFIQRDETANWKTYKNEEYGFEIKYPETWLPPKTDKWTPRRVTFLSSDYAEETMGKVIIRGEITAGTKIILELFDIPQNLIWQDWAVLGRDAAGSVVSSEFVNVANREVFRIFMEGSKAESITGRNYIQIRFPDQDERREAVLTIYTLSVDREENEKILNQILSTLRFIK